MPVFTIQNLVDRAAAISDMHDTFVKPEQWLSWYNTERRALQFFMVRHGSTMQNLTEEFFTAPDVVDLTTEAIAIVGVWEVLPTSFQFRKLRVVDLPNNFHQFTGGSITGPAQEVSVESVNSSTASTMRLRFFPRDPSGTYAVVMAEVADFAVSLNDTTSLPIGIEERIVLGMARRALIKEESDTAAIDKLIRETDSMVEEFVWSRSLAQSPSVRNVDFVERGWTSDRRIPPCTEWTFV